MIEARNLTFAVAGRRLVEDVNLAATPGRLTIIIGPNGAGKSTLLKLLSGELRPSEGSVTYEGTDIGRLSAAQLARRRAVLPQSVTLAFPFTVEEIVLLGAEAGGARGRAAVALCEAMLADVGLGGWGVRLYERLSGGEQQRVQFARVLAQIPEPYRNGKTQFLFLDEPTSSLDIRHQIDLLERARRHARLGGGVIAIVHDLNLAAEFADRIAVLSQGRLIAHGPPQETLCEEVVARVFDVSGIVGRTPPEETPFVLTQARHPPSAD
ncbi:Hemin import ATP-binding protein HmuV [Hartmannibacter diazotrophicus]|uniref:Hemin import ATP-binding protein HmuV n=1 Tax=Hartmannibacter diazotrophicus TaxID=1482074 RepID=A0A2C9D2P6_9HYPH|nr:heme ABC transporter ATP-binding protein [Hartmannibacter diazotrophicus]SON54582.1 Hemin import ATP-binding protein HmuV [Hartmannibacter diazotrophicus]